MKNNNLILHPDDRSTDFLSPVHQNIQNKTIVTGGLLVNQIIDNLICHDNTILMGHGTGNGLLSVGRFPNQPLFVINNDMAEILRQKNNNIFIWCYASEYAIKNKIQSFCTGMFISEKSEANYYGFYGVSDSVIDESNNCFVNVVSNLINEDNVKKIYEGVMESEYNLLSRENPIAAYNYERIRFTHGK